MKLLLNQLRSISDSNKLLFTKQFVWSRCLTNLTCTHLLHRNRRSLIENNKYKTTIPLDLSKALDSTNHDVLYKKLGFVRFDKKSFRMISAFKMKNFKNF